MVKTFLKLSVLLVLMFLTSPAKADSFLLSESNSEDHIIPLVYISDMEYYNHTTTAAYTPKIVEQLSLEPKLIITEDKDLADYILQPKLIQSKIALINSENSRYSMSVAVELKNKDGIIIKTEQQNRYIIIENTQNPQKIARKLIVKLLEKALGNIILTIKNSPLHIG